MKPPVSPFTAIYTQWLESFRAMFPGVGPTTPSTEVTLPPKAEKAAAVQEWEDEGGSIKPAPATEAKDAPKIPF
jgi:hypothetical protein